MSKKYQGPQGKDCNVNSPVKESKNPVRCNNDKNDKKKCDDKNKKDEKKNNDKNHDKHGLLLAAGLCHPADNKGHENNDKHHKNEKLDFCNDKVEVGGHKGHVNHSENHGKPCAPKSHDNKPCDTKPHNEKPCNDKPTDHKPCDTKPHETKPCDNKPPEHKPCEPKPCGKPVEPAHVLCLKPEPCTLEKNHITEDLNLCGKTYQFTNLLLNDHSSGLSDSCLKIVAANLTSSGAGCCGGVTIKACSSSLGDKNGYKTFDVSHDGHHVNFQVFTNGTYLLSGDVVNTFNFLNCNQVLNFKLCYTVSDGCSTGQTYADVCIMGKNDCPVISVGDMCIQLKGCEPCNDSAKLKDCTNVVINDVDCGDVAKLSVKFEGLNGDGKCVENIGCKTFTVEQLKCGVDIGHYGKLQLDCNGKLCFTSDPNSHASKALAEGQCVELKFTAMATDKSCCTTTDCFTVKVKGGNEAPCLATKNEDLCIRDADCQNDCERPADLCASFDTKVTDVDCNDKFTLKFTAESETILCDGCPLVLPGFCLLVPCDIKCGDSVSVCVAPGITATYTAGKDGAGHFEYKISPDNPLLEHLNDHQAFKVEIKVVAEDKAGCKDVACETIAVCGGNQAPTICIPKEGKDLHIKDADCQDCKETPADLCAGFDVNVKDDDCDDKFTLKFTAESETILCDGCPLVLPGFCLLVPCDIKCGDSVSVCVAPGITATYTAGKDGAGHFEYKISPDNPLLEHLNDHQAFKVEIKVVAEDKAGCKDVACETIAVCGGNQAPTICIPKEGEDLHIKDADCQDCKETPADLCAGFDVNVKDDDCDDKFTLKFTAESETILCDGCPLVLPGFCLLVPCDIKCGDSVSVCVAPGITATYTAGKDGAGHFEYKISPDNPLLEHLNDHQAFKVEIKVVAEDKAGCKDVACETIAVCGGNQAPTICIPKEGKDLHIKDADCQDCKETPADLCAGFDVNVKDDDCDDKFTLKFTAESETILCDGCPLVLPGFCLLVPCDIKCGDSVSVCVAPGITATYTAGKDGAGHFEYKISPDNPLLEHLNDHQAFKVEIKVVAEDKAGCKDVACETIAVCGGNQAPTICIPKEGEDLHIKDADCQDCKETPADLCAGFDVNVKDDDCDDKFTLKFTAESETILCDGCPLVLPGFCLLVPCDIKCGDSVSVCVAPGITATYTAGKDGAGHFEYKISPDNPLLEHLNDHQAFKVEIKVVAEDKAGCKDVACETIAVCGGNQAPTICIPKEGEDLHIKDADCQDCKETPADLCAGFDVNVKDDDCDDKFTLKFTAESETILCDGCPLVLPGFCLLVPCDIKCGDSVSVCVAPGITATYTAGKDGAGHFEYKISPDNPLLEPLNDHQAFKVEIKVVAEDKAGCKDVACETIAVCGGNQAPCLVVCHDLIIQMAEDCNPCDSRTHLADSTPLLLSDPDCGDKACFEKVEFKGFDDGCGHVIPDQCWTVVNGFLMPQMITLPTGDNLGYFMVLNGVPSFMANPNSPTLIKLDEGCEIKLGFELTATDGKCESSSCLTVDIKGGANCCPQIHCSDNGGNTCGSDDSDIIYCGTGNHNITGGLGVDHTVFDLNHCFKSGSGDVAHILDFNKGEDVLSFCHINSGTGPLHASDLTGGLNPCVKVADTKIDGKNCISLSIDSNHDGHEDGKVIIDGHKTSDYYGANANNFLSVLEQHAQLICTNDITHA